MINVAKLLDDELTEFFLNHGDSIIYSLNAEDLSEYEKSVSKEQRMEFINGLASYDDMTPSENTAYHLGRIDALRLILLSL